MDKFISLIEARNTIAQVALSNDGDIHREAYKIVNKLISKYGPFRQIKLEWIYKALEERRIKCK